MLCCVCHWSCCLWLRQRFFQHLLQYHICHCLFFTLSALRYFLQCGVKYYSQRVCGMWSVGMSVCMCKSSSQKLDVQTSPNFSACCLWFWLGPRLATLHTLCTSGFVDARWRHVYPWSTGRQGHQNEVQKWLIMGHRSEVAFFLCCSASKLPKRRFLRLYTAGIKLECL